MNPAEAVALLYIVAVLLVDVARRIRLAWPIFLVAAGCVASVIPGIPNVTLPPDLVLLVFLPPLLYWEAATSPTAEFRRRAPWIVSLAFGLVIASTLAVAVVAHAIVPSMPWAIAFVLGALLAPTDELALAPVAERMRIPRRLMAVVSGESLVNDATALVIYAIAVGAVVSGSFSLAHAAFGIVWTTVASVAFGLAVAFAVHGAWHALRDPRLEVAIALVAPFATYEPAERLGLSGVLAVVAGALYLTKVAPHAISPAARIQGTGFYETVVFSVNAVLFLLVGLQFRAVATAGHVPLGLALIGSAAIFATLVGVRFAWVFAFARLRAALSRGPSVLPRGYLTFLSLTGIRGGVSLAAALALPLAARGAAFPFRDFVIFTAFAVIVGTLAIGALPLPWLVSRLRLPPDDAEASERSAAWDFVATLPAFQSRERARDAIEERRGAAIALRDRGTIDNLIFQDVEYLLDLRQLYDDELTDVWKREV